MSGSIVENKDHTSQQLEKSNSSMTPVEANKMADQPEISQEDPGKEKVKDHTYPWYSRELCAWARLPSQSIQRGYL